MATSFASDLSGDTFLSFGGMSSGVSGWGDEVSTVGSVISDTSGIGWNWVVIIVNFYVHALCFCSSWICILCGFDMQ